MQTSNTHILQLRIESIDNKIKLCRAVMKASPSHFTNEKILLLRQKKLQQLQEQKINLQIELAEFLKLVSLLVLNQISFEIINSKIFI